MERQLVKHGASTLMVSLPKKWLDEQKLEKGGKIHITQSSDRLIISPQERKKERLETSVHFTKADYEEIRTVLGTLYRNGYERILVKFDDYRCIYLIQLIIKAILGFEIIDQCEKSCVIKNITPEIDVDTGEILNKIVNIIKAEFVLVKDYLENGIKGKDSEIKMFRDDCWKFRNIVYVHLKETLLSSAYDKYFLVHLVEYNASFLYWIYRSFDRSSLEKVSPNFLKLYTLITDYFNESIFKMKKKDTGYIDYLMINRDKLLNECEKYALTNQEDRFLAVYLGMLIQNIPNPKSLIV